ncbi:ABC transporter permease [Streptomyces coelicoflavus]|uniref:ABC transporter permease n=1 Tax=Streptomyces coelicoflavus TaxID=285562 RepID=A0A6N9UWY0_9ACTN|nr:MULTISPECIES: ABC transporter permease [Streptomyces]EHN75124.1 ABC-2 type transporter [Streptomyces coelicoflavus ZG0656]KPC87669.1 ABC transporter [Streptomyces sp. NRRL WC-3753]MZE46020.1 ABC transporter permease [Streptomyces sp. SID5477]MCW1097384.1 ABC transporter permease [Streptomyces sp. RS2]NEB20879.1 ABC transporter permease [Streptomyces coelicoflavus]
MTHWLRSYGLLLGWTALRSRATLPLNLVIQTCLAVGIIVGFAYLVPEMDDATALYLATGAPVLGLITVGMVIGPQEVASSKQEGIFDFNRSLPVPRSALIASDATIALLTALPGMVAALVVAGLRFDLDLDISPLVLPAVLLTAFTAIGLGYGIGYGMAPPVARLMSQLVVFVALMFSPITFPASRLPDWFESVHTVLPFQYMAEAVRDTLATPADGVSGLPFAVLAAWTLGGFLLTHRVITRRP